MQLAHKVVDFLSHLCDGEGRPQMGTGAQLFLSHLCGGEARKESKQAGQEFLSHLCGDEESP